MPSDSETPPPAPRLPLFYKEPRPLFAGRDDDLGLQPTTGHGFAASTNSVPLLASELPAACKHYPVLFTDGEVPQLAALLGLRAAENLFVGADGTWDPHAYVPAYVRRYPFIFLESGDGSQLTLCVDMAAEAVVRGHGNLLFENGEPSPVAKSALEYCREFQAQHAATTAFAAAVQEAGLLVENRADVTLADGRRLSLAGFKVIDEARFDALPAETILLWRERRWLPFVYCHFIAAGNWAALTDRAAARAA